MKKILLLAVVTLLFTACEFKATKELKQQNDSLLLANAQKEKEINAYFEAINEIDANFEKIRDAQNFVAVKSGEQKIDEDSRTRINENIQLVAELLQKNKEQIAKLESQLKKSNTKMIEMQKTIDRLKANLEEKTQIIESLQADLASRDEKIVQLGDEVRNLNQNVSNLSDENKKKADVISSQDEAIHSAWYVFGSRKELKAQKILTTDGLFSPTKILQKDFNKDSFVKVDIRNTKRISLYAKRAKVLTTHPKDSYVIEKDGNNLFIEIKNTTQFWSVSKYLVVEVD